jgi:DNA-binding LacI/PurR family transcriptional regulator
MIQNEEPDAIVNTIVPDDYEGMKTILRHVISKGHRKIAILKPPVGGSAGAARFKGAMDALSENKIKPEYIAETKEFSFDAGYKAANEIFANAPDSTCIAASSDLAAYGISAAAKEKGIKIPEDISLTGADGLQWHSEKQLSTYISPSYQIGIKGAELLIKKLSDKNSSPEKICLPCKFIEGETVKAISSK